MKVVGVCGKCWGAGGALRGLGDVWGKIARRKASVKDARSQSGRASQGDGRPHLLVAVVDQPRQRRQRLLGLREEEGGEGRARQEGEAWAAARVGTGPDSARDVR